MKKIKRLERVFFDQLTVRIFTGNRKIFPNDRKFPSPAFSVLPAPYLHWFERAFLAGGSKFGNF